MNKHVIKHLVGNSEPVIFEIGAADGGDTKEFVEIFRDVNMTMFCFEPEPTNINIFKSRNFSPLVQLFEGVISNMDGEIQFLRSRLEESPNALRYSGSIKKPKEHLKEWPQILFDEEATVKTVKLDTFCEKNNIDRIDFIWADVQGAEEEMILGGIETFRTKVRFLYTEYSNKEYYEGQKNLRSIMDLLGKDWVLVKDFGTDALFQNKTL